MALWLFLAGDFNINLFNQNRAIVEKYKNTLETFNLTHHILLPTRKGKKLKDHLISNSTFQPL